LEEGPSVQSELNSHGHDTNDSAQSPSNVSTSNLNDIGEFSSIYQNVLGIVPDIMLSYTDFANPVANVRSDNPVGASSPAPALSSAASDSSTAPAVFKKTKYTDRSQLIQAVIKGLPSKSDAGKLVDKYYGQVTIE
jgi:hypothetical protein